MSKGNITNLFFRALYQPYLFYLSGIVYGMIQKAAKGDTSAAKFLKEINGEGASPDENGITDLRSLSDVVLCRLAGFTLEKLMQSEV